MDLKLNTISGIKWSSISQFSRQLIQFTVTIILSRILQPSDYGLMGMALVAINFASIFRDIGASSAIIQKQEISTELLSSIFWFNTTIGFLISSILFVFAHTISDIFNQEKLSEILQVLSFSLFISSLSTTQQALLEKSLKFDVLAKIEITSVVISAIIAIISALFGMGVWSLVIQSFTLSLITFVLLWMNNTAWRPKLYFRYNELRKVISYSLNYTGFIFINYFSRNADSFIIGKYLGAESLGYYSLAYRIMLYPLQNITVVISRVIFPYYSKLGNDIKSIGNAYKSIIKNIGFISIPIMLLVMVNYDLIIVTLFGPQWMPASILLLILAPIGIAQSIDATTGSIYQSRGRTDLLFYWGIFTGVLSILFFSIGVQYGIYGMGISYLLATIIWTYPGLYIPLKLIDVTVKEIVSSLKGHFIFAGIALLGSFIVKIILSSLLSAQATLILDIVAFISIYLTIVFYLDREQLLSVINIISRKNID